MNTMTKQTITYVVQHAKELQSGQVLYVPVAAVTIMEDADEHPREHLDRVFELTNHIEHPWWENEGVRMLRTSILSTRSTSVGDRITCDIPEHDLHYQWEVKPAGFHEIS